MRSSVLFLWGGFLTSWKRFCRRQNYNGHFPDICMSMNFDIDVFSTS